MSLGCAKCGDCCNPVWVATRFADRFNEWWLYWQRGGKAWTRSKNPNAQSIRFAAEHWTEIERRGDQVSLRCDRYDPEAHACTAHDDRPPVCSGYPWYGGDEDDIRKKAPELARHCSFLLDVAPADRGPDARPLIPLTVKAAA